MSNGLSFHVIHDAIYQQTASLYPILDTLQPRVINIVSGARKTEAVGFAVDLLKRYPKMRVIYRAWPDDGNHAREQYKLAYHFDGSGKLVVDSTEGVRNWIRDNQEYLKLGLTVLTDNESVNDQMSVYAMWQSLIMDICAEKGWKVAVGRFAVGNPRETDYAKLDFMWRSLAKHHPLHCWSPNEYLPPDIATASGMLGRYKLGIARAKAIGAWPFDVSIGEYGIVYRHGSGVLDAEAGYKDSRIGWSGKQAARYLINQWKTWYQPDNVDAAIYCYGDSDGGKWGRFRVDNDGGFMNELLNAAKTGELKVEAMAEKPLPTVPEPSNKGEGQPITIEVKQNYTYINLRTLPSLTGIDIGNIARGEKGVIYPSSITSDGDYNWYWFERTVTPNGEGTKGWITYKMPVISIPLPPVDPPPPPDPEPVPVPLPVPYVEITSEAALAMSKTYDTLSKQYAALSATWKTIADMTARTESVTKQAA